MAPPPEDNGAAIAVASRAAARAFRTIASAQNQKCPENGSKRHLPRHGAAKRFRGTPTLPRRMACRTPTRPSRPERTPGGHSQADRRIAVSHQVRHAGEWSDRAPAPEPNSMGMNSIRSFVANGIPASALPLLRPVKTTDQKHPSTALRMRPRGWAARERHLFRSPPNGNAFRLARRPSWIHIARFAGGRDRLFGCAGTRRPMPTAVRRALRRGIFLGDVQSHGLPVFPHRQKSDQQNGRTADLERHREQIRQIRPDAIDGRRQRQQVEHIPILRSVSPSVKSNQHNGHQGHGDKDTRYPAEQQPLCNQVRPQPELPSIPSS